MAMLGRRLGARHAAALLVGLAIAVAACGGDGGGDGDDFESVSIAQARAQPFGAKLKIEGIVSAPPGAYASIYGDQGFVIQQGTDGGIYVTVGAVTGVELGDEVKVEGTKRDISGTIAIEGGNILVTGATGDVGAATTSTGGVTVNIEGRLVFISGTITQGVVADLPTGYAFVVDDGTGPVEVFVATSAGFNPLDDDALAVGRTVSVVGVVARVDGTIEVLPRFATDINPPTS
jgi:hypothetical protein